jgi:hypothetical protein
MINTDGGMAVMRLVGLRGRTILGAAVIVGSLAGSTPGAGAESPVVLDSTGVSVAAYGGWAAWSRRDAATGHYALVLRSPAGAISLPAIPENTAPFDVELGPAGGSEVAAVYSRCANDATRKGCHLAELQLGGAGAVERALAPPGGGSDHQPAIWDGALAFLRRNPPGDGRRPDALLVWQIGSRRVRSLALPSSRSAHNGEGTWPRGLTGSITALSFNGRQVAYVTANSIGTFGESTLWFEPLSARPQLIDQETGGAGNVCPPEFVSPVLAGPWLYAYLHACDPSANPDLDRLTRYRRGEVERARNTFIHFGDEGITSIVPDGAGVDWDSAGIQRLATVAWRRIPAPVPQTFCSRSDPFC